MSLIRKLLEWAQKNERHLGAVVFLGGFATDIATFTLLDLSAVSALLGGYLGISTATVFLNHVIASRQNARETVIRKTLLVLLPLAAQYFLGNLLSGFLIFYTKSAALSVSWPFLLLLLAVFIGNEWFRKYKDRLAFLGVLLFFSAYMYAIFAFPLLVHALGPWIFLGSSAIAAGAFGIFLWVLWLVEKKQVMTDLPQMIGSSIAILLVVVTSYFTGLLPPIPLTLKESGIYHSLTRKEGNYVVTAEPERPWYDPRPAVVHVQTGERIHAFTALFAPVRFSATERHVWEHEENGKWIVRSDLSFPISGGRGGGYRGYSEFLDPTPGNWRVRVETENGQVIGIIRFSVEQVAEAPILHEETH